MKRVNEEERQAALRMTAPNKLNENYFSCQEIMNTLWSFSTLNFQNECRELFEEATPYINSRINAAMVGKENEQFTSQELANILLR